MAATVAMASFIIRRTKRSVVESFDSLMFVTQRKYDESEDLRVTAGLLRHQLPDSSTPKIFS